MHNPILLENCFKLVPVGAGLHCSWFASIYPLKWPAFLFGYLELEPKLSKVEARAGRQSKGHHPGFALDLRFVVITEHQALEQGCREMVPLN